MRPCTLEIEGFSGFADRVCVDFTEDDLFAIVGATGAGKSSIVDAIVFALYGSIPRYRDQRLVGLAIHKRRAAARVRLDFEVDGVGHTAVRIVRRTKAGASTKEARLQRGDEVLAASAPEMNVAVLGLLGLDLDQFCRTIVLPQGAFAQFLQDTPGDRQELLKQLLGLGLYERIRARAGERARAAASAASTLEARIEELGVATDDEVASARRRLDDLSALQEAVREALADLDAQRRAVADLDTSRGLLEERLALLSRIEVSDDVATLDAAMDHASIAARAAETAVVDADGALEAARTALDTLPTIDRVDTWLAARAENDRLSAQQVLLAELVEQVAPALAEADDLRSIAMAAQEQREAATAAITLLASVVAPDHVDELAVRHASAEADRRDAAAELVRAQEAETADNRARSALPSRSEATDRLVAARARDQVVDDVAAAARTVEESDEDHRTAERAHQASTTALAAASAVLDDARRQAGAAAIAHGLHVGDACPVCARPLDAKPDVAASDGLAAAEAALATARSEHDRATARLAAAAERRSRATAERDRLEARLAAVTEAASVAELEQIVASVDDAERTAEVARQRVDAARAARDEADRAVAATSSMLDSARTELVAAVACCRSLDPPDVGEGVAAGWAGLVRWRDERTTEIEATLAAADRAVASARSARDRLFATLAPTIETAGFEVPTTTDALRALASAAAERTTANADRLAQLALDLAAVPDLEDLGRLRVTRRDAESRRDAADVACVDARAAHRAAREALERASSAVVTHRAALVATRDTVASLGAPIPAGGRLGDDWAALTDWAESTRASLSDEAAALEASSLATHATVTEGEAVVRDRLEAAGVHAEGDPGTLVVEARTRAVDAVDRLEAARARARELRAEHETHRRMALVADALQTHLRTDRFERWLLTEAQQELVAGATERIQVLSSGAYSLVITPDGKDFEVIDHRNADERRSVKTLSGGELFLTSLALALALADQIGELAEQPVSLESLFLDEGFGTLDPDTLDVVASAIEELGSSGRMVGVITHVRELADRLPVRFEVVRAGTRTTVDRVTA